MLIIELPWPPRVLSPNSRRHWARKSAAARDYRVDCLCIAREAMKKQRFKLSKQCTTPGSLDVWMDFYPPDRRLRDDDNCIASFKSGRDGLAKALGCDDRIFRIHPFLQPDPVEGGKVVVRIGAREDAKPENE